MALFKKLFIVVILLLFIRSIIHDVTVGTASKPQDSHNTQTEMMQTENKETSNESTNGDQPEEKQPDYKPVKHKVKAGETVLSIVENMSDESVEFQQLLEDFQTLNPDVNPNEIQIGKTYFFPAYMNKN
ncbi:hypothetical protein SAMN05421676_106136 [Salinibacillus kushneri]|uniref:LysM domain-containing protein n=1 Tax=Salinibacillus kushneri TaxID=237682 RepID=A0A1I0FX60_9BACI|nr:LysM domain-containing protein [Salinibacillus kushneri]SET63138.1 hypothetical protein SAMN05421676_106136 [Salinibacillus kushneri]